MKVLQVCKGDLLPRNMYLATLVWTMSILSFSNSP